MTAREDTNPTEGPKGDEAILAEIRQRYKFLKEYWRDDQAEREIDIRYLCNNPWTDEDRLAREGAGRPCLNQDELNQYVNQCVNNARQNPRGIKVEPEGNGANDKTASFREDLVRTIEYRSKAQSIYLQAFQDEVEGGYGFVRVSRKYVDNDSDEQEIVIRPIPNPDSVLYGSDQAKEPDWSDAPDCFVLDPMPKDEFKRQWPDADITSFSHEDVEDSGDWITDDTVMVCEYWKLEKKPRTNKHGRKVIDVQLVQYLTNGIKILDRLKQPGKELSIVPFIGMQRWTKESSGTSKRRVFSLPRFARDAQMGLAYFVTMEAEEAGLTPKVPFEAYVGQCETDAEAINNITKVPRAVIQWDVVVDGTGAVLPRPTRTPFTPNFQAYEVAIEAKKRAIQASMGVSPLPTAAQRQNEKSGIALKQIQSQQEIGSFHFMDGYERGITRVGRVVDSWIEPTYGGDTDRRMSLKKADDSRRLVVMGRTEAAPPDEEEIDSIEVGDEDHAVTIATGPSADSQRQAADDFLDLLVTNLENLPIAPPQKAKLVSMAIEMKQLGPKGDEMAQVISPPDQNNLPPQAQAMLAQSQQQMQQLNAYAKDLEVKNQQLEFEKKASVVNNEYKIQLEQMRLEAAALNAEITTKAQNLSERQAFLEDMWKQFHSQAHDVAIQASGAGQQQDLADQQNQATAAQQAQAAQQQPQQDQQ